jgi:hypothetical protein
VAHPLLLDLLIQALKRGHAPHRRFYPTSRILLNTSCSCARVVSFIVCRVMCVYCVGVGWPLCTWRRRWSCALCQPSTRPTLDGPKP